MNKRIVITIVTFSIITASLVYMGHRVYKSDSEQIIEQNPKECTDATLLYDRGYKHYKNKNYDEALFWLRQSAQYNPDAMDLIGYMYHTGEGVARDDEEAFEWCSRTR